MNAAALLDRLEKVRRTGPGRWMSACPAHDDKSPSLSIRETDDGRVLLHDFGGCDVHGVLAALGMTLSDLFPDKPDDHKKSTRSRVPLRDLVGILDHESLIIYIIAFDFVEKKQIDDESFSRLRVAVQRISGVRNEII